MTRSIMLLITLIMISFSLSVMPLDVKSFEINFEHVFQPVENPSETTEQPSSFTMEAVTSEKSLHFNLQTLSFKAMALDNAPEDWTKLISGSLIIQDAVTSKEVIRLENDKLTQALLIKPKTNNQSAEIEVNLDGFHLVNGFYTVQFQLNSAEFKDQFAFDIHQFRVLPYTTHRDTQSITAMKLYFADASQSLLIPVYQPIPSTDRMIRSALNGLLEVPQGMGLYDSPLVPRVSRADFTAGVTTCSLLTRDLSDDMTEEQAKLTFESIAKTLFAIQSTYIINQVEFKVDSNTNYTYKGVDLSQPYTAHNNALVYLPYSSNNTLLLAPFELGTNDPNTAIPTILSAMTGLEGVVGPEQIDPLLPKRLKLINHHIEGRNLVLNFDETFKILYTKQPDLQNMLLDALALSFTSIEGVDQITIQINGSDFDGWDNAPIKEALLPPAVFNVVQ